MRRQGKRRRRSWTVVDAAALGALAFYALSAWNVRQAGLAVEAAQASVHRASAPGLRIQARLKDRSDARLELRLYRRVGGVHLLEHCAGVKAQGGRVRYLYPAPDPHAAYTVVLTDETGCWCRLELPSRSGLLVLRPGPAPWFL
jgi:hypothetical protein